MFERYTEKARRVIFFARYEASQYGSPYIETEHLLLGLLREDRALTKLISEGADAHTTIRAEIESRITKRERIGTSVEVPLSKKSKEVLNLAADEAERLVHRYVSTAHLLLGMLQVEDSLACRILQARGVKAAAVREFAAKALLFQSRQIVPSRKKSAMLTLKNFLAGFRSHKAGEELLPFFTENAEFVDVFGKRWNLEGICNEFETLFAPYAKKNAMYLIEETLAETNDFVVVIVLWKNAILASLERAWMHRMSVVLVAHADDWAILLAQVTPVQPK